MIEELYIRDLGVISEARLSFTPGLTVLTGETGAGKTMVLSALGLLLGERSDSGSVRSGQPQAYVEGRWLLPETSQVAARLSERVLEAGGAMDHGELILNRSVSSEGRSRAAVGGRATPVSLLTELAEQLVVVHGQSDQIRLRSAAAQREALDQFAGRSVIDPLAAYQAHFRAWREIERDLTELKAMAQQRERELAELRQALEDIDAVDPQPGEAEALKERSERLSNLETLREAASRAHDALSGEGDGGDAIGQIAQARRALEQVSGHDPELGALAEQLKELGFQANELAAALSGYLTSLDSGGPAELDQIQERRARLNALVRRFGPSLEDVIAYRAEAAEKLLLLDNAEERIAGLEASMQEQFRQLTEYARQISDARSQAAQQLEAAVSTELANLAMGGARVVVQVIPLEEYGLHGRDQVNILLAAYPGAEPRPLNKGASGGELSRIMLAIEVVVSKGEQVPTFIFDEVDAGVGGAAAIEVGRRLALLAKQAQVIVVTHLAQVAAFANNHLRVLKTSQDEYTVSDVVQLSESERLTELARMLSGLADSETARTHAAELLALARG